MEVHLRTPLKEDEVRSLRVGDIVYLSGVVVTARDRAHRRLVELAESGRRPPVDLKGLAIYHCGPLAVEEDGGWRIVSAGPTTSVRMEPLESRVIEAFEVRMIVGKGGMGERTSEALKRFGAVYCSLTGGVGSLAASSIKEVVDVHWLDLGVPEAMWALEVEELGPMIVSMDSHGGNLYRDILSEASRRVRELLGA